MINNCPLTTCDRQTLSAIAAGSLAREAAAEAMNQGIMIRFLQQSASYLGADLSRQELASRYLRHESSS